MVNRHPLDGAGFRTPRSKAQCFSGDICQDGNLFSVASQAASTLKFKGETLADFSFDVVLKISCGIFAPKF